MKTASAAKIAADFNEYLEASQDQPVLITRNGKAVAVLLAVQDKADAEQLAVGRSRSLRSIFKRPPRRSRREAGFLTTSFGGKWNKAETRSRPARKAAARPRSDEIIRRCQQALQLPNAAAA